MEQTFSQNEKNSIFSFCIGIFFVLMVYFFYEMNDLKKDLEQVKENQNLHMLAEETSRRYNIVSVPFADSEEIYCKGEGPFGPNCYNRLPINIPDAVQLIIDHSGYKYEKEKTSNTPARFVK